METTAECHSHALGTKAEGRAGTVEGSVADAQNQHVTLELRSLLRLALEFNGLEYLGQKILRVGPV